MVQEESADPGEAFDVQPSGGRTQAWGSTHGATDGGGTTGDAAVDAALQALTQLDRRPVHEHAAVFEQVHRSLQDRLADDSVADPGHGRE
ncbi:hypothetical protein [Phytoactinopolyspora halotolerans]|uniref:Uncharacterized protein n=1 Tax=Phytoactinopolyspora halotolerans TaxID=1981512 RepID=A0A6L9SHS0_9ACTN|nr:hypothetical protein [Phytoactinopolyspora halotolerans]NEE04683.1 hypothetical protein [Phytoactinopolyspora halotolerans]